MFEKDCRA